MCPQRANPATRSPQHTPRPMPTTHTIRHPPMTPTQHTLWDYFPCTTTTLDTPLLIPIPKTQLDLLLDSQSASSSVQTPTHTPTDTTTTTFLHLPHSHHLPIPTKPIRLGWYMTPTMTHGVTYGQFQ